MLFGAFKEVVKNRRLIKIAKQTREGIVPRGITKEEILEALRLTRPKGVVELFGFLSARHFGADGALKADLGLQSVKKVTTAFVKHLADALCNSAVAMDDFVYHAVGRGSAAEASGDALLGAEEATRVTGSQTHGATSNIFRTVRTYVAATAFTAIEHGIFDTLATSSGVLLDRSLVSTPPTLATGDEVEFTYDLTINSET